MHVKNSMHVNAISDLPPTNQLTINLAHDYEEVRGFGKPITKAVASSMMDEYYSDCKKAYKIVEALEIDQVYTSTFNDPNVKALKRMLDPETQVVSGVFGKEIILQILAQRDCEGIRYSIATDGDGKSTVILYGVYQVKNNDGTDATSKRQNSDGTIYTVAMSSALSNIIVDETDTISTNVLIGEVHENSLTRAQADAKPRIGESIASVLFGEY